MINFIKENTKVNNLYLGQADLNKIVREFKEVLIENKQKILEIYKIDNKNCMQSINFETMLYILKMYENEEINKKNKKTITAALYYGNPYITINLCMHALLQKKAIMALIYDSLLGINKFIINAFNSILKKYRITSIIELFNCVKIEEIKKFEKCVDKIICMGNTNLYYQLKKQDIEKLEYIPFNNMAIYCDEDEYSQLQFELYNYLTKIGIEAEICEEDIEEFIEYVNLNNELENIVILSKSNEVIQKAKQEIKKHKIYINENPLKEEKFKIPLV